MVFCAVFALPVLATPTIPASAYVQREIVAQWDAIENGGRGVHNDDVGASGWVDLIGGVKLEAYLGSGGSGSVTTGEKGILLNAASLRAYNNGTAKTIVNVSGTAHNTVEISGSDTGTGANRWVMFQSGNADANNKRIFGWVNNTTTQRILDYFYVYNNRSLTLELDEPPAVDTPFTMSAVRMSATDFSVYKDGVFCAKKTVANAQTATVSNGGISLHAIAYNSEPETETTPTYCALRIYKRQLSAAEVAFNANIDKIRFCGADPKTLDWPDGYRWNAEKDTLEYAVTVAYGSGIVSVTADGEEIADGGRVWVAWNDGRQKFVATLDAGCETAQWSATNVTVATSVHDKSATVSAAFSPTCLMVAGVSKSSLGDLPISGLVQHLDAADLDTITTNEAGNVLEWRSKAINAANPGAVPALRGWCYTNSFNESCFPFYSASQLEGRGGIVTGRSLAGEKAGKTVCVLSGMTGTVATVNRTVFFVMRPFAKLDKINRGVFFGEAGGNDALYLYTTSNSQGIYNQGGFCAGGWLWQDGYCFSQPGSAGNSSWGPTILKTTGRTQVVAAECTVAKTVSYPLFRPAIARAYATNYGHVHGAYGELVIYDRELTQGEITYVNARLRDKWLDSDIVHKRTQWIGGGSGSWTDAANWDNGLPERDRVAVIANAVVSVPAGSHCMWDLELKDATLNLSAGASVRVEEVTAAYGNVMVAVPTGAIFSTDDYCEPWGAGPTVALAGGQFVYAPRPTSVRRSWLYPRDCTSDVGSVTATQFDGNVLEATHHSMLPKVTGTGLFTCAGAGVTELDADHLPAEGLSFVVGGGALELNGLDLKVKSLGGTAILRNSGARVATVTVENAGDSLLTPHLEGAVKVVAKGGGTFRHVGGGEAKGGIEVDGSTLAAAAGVVVREYGNPVIHLDASMPGTIVTNAAGEVLRWNSTDAHGQSFSVHPVTTVNNKNYTNSAPVWSATSFNGKPAVLFSTTVDGSAMKETAKPALIRSATATTNLTFFAVGRFYGGASSDAGAKYFSFVGSGHGVNVSSLYGQSCGTTEADKIWRFSASFPYALDNGKVIYDYDNGFAPTIVYSALLNRDVVVAYRAGEAVPGVYAPRIGCCDGSYATRSMSGQFCEVLVYDQRLSDEAMKEISAQLMKKWGIEPSEEADPVATKGSLNSQSAIALKNGAAIDLGGETNVVRKLETSGNVTVSNGALKVGALDVVLGDDGAYGAVRGDADWDIDGMALAFVGDARPGCGNVVRTSGTIFGTLGPITPSAVAPRVNTSVSRIWIPGGLLLFVR